MYDEQKIEQVREGKACIFYDKRDNEFLDLQELVKYIFPNDPNLPKGWTNYYMKRKGSTVSEWGNYSDNMGLKEYSIKEFKLTKMKVELELEKLKEAYSEADVSQKTLLKNLYPKEVEEIAKFDGLLSADLIGSNICKRSIGDYENKGYYLSTAFQWEIVKDNCNVSVLIAKRK